MLEKPEKQAWVVREKEVEKEVRNLPEKVVEVGVGKESVILEIVGEKGGGGKEGDLGNQETTQTGTTTRPSHDIPGVLPRQIFHAALSRDQNCRAPEALQEQTPAEEISKLREKGEAAGRLPLSKEQKNEMNEKLEGGLGQGVPEDKGDLDVSATELKGKELEGSVLVNLETQKVTSRLEGSDSTPSGEPAKNKKVSDPNSEPPQESLQQTPHLTTSVMKENVNEELHEIKPSLLIDLSTLPSPKEAGARSISYVDSTSTSAIDTTSAPTREPQLVDDVMSNSLVDTVKSSVPTTSSVGTSENELVPTSISSTEVEVQPTSLVDTVGGGIIQTSLVDSTGIRTTPALIAGSVRTEALPTSLVDTTQSDVSSNLALALLVGDSERDVTPTSLVDTLRSDVTHTSLVDTLRSDAIPTSLVDSLSHNVTHTSLVGTLRSDITLTSSVDTSKSDLIPTSSTDTLRNDVTHPLLVDKLSDVMPTSLVDTLRNDVTHPLSVDTIRSDVIPTSSVDTLSNVTHPLLVDTLRSDVIPTSLVDTLSSDVTPTPSVDMSDVRSPLFMDSQKSEVVATSLVEKPTSNEWTVSLSALPSTLPGHHPEFPEALPKGPGPGHDFTSTPEVATAPSVSSGGIMPSVAPDAGGEFGRTLFNRTIHTAATSAATDLACKVGTSPRQVFVDVATPSSTSITTSTISVVASSTVPVFPCPTTTTTTSAITYATTTVTASSSVSTTSGVFTTCATTTAVTTADTTTLVPTCIATTTVSNNDVPAHVLSEIGKPAVPASTSATFSTTDHLVTGESAISETPATIGVTPATRPSSVKEEVTQAKTEACGKVTITDLKSSKERDPVPSLDAYPWLRPLKSLQVDFTEDKSKGFTIGKWTAIPIETPSVVSKTPVTTSEGELADMEASLFTTEFDTSTKSRDFATGSTTTTTTTSEARKEIPEASRTVSGSSSAAPVLSFWSTGSFCCDFSLLSETQRATTRERRTQQSKTIRNERVIEKVDQGNAVSQKRVRILDDKDEEPTPETKLITPTEEEVLTKDQVQDSEIRLTAEKSSELRGIIRVGRYPESGDENFRTERAKEEIQKDADEPVTFALPSWLSSPLSWEKETPAPASPSISAPSTTSLVFPRGVDTTTSIASISSNTSSYLPPRTISSISPISITSVASSPYVTSPSAASPLSSTFPTWTISLAPSFAISSFLDSAVICSTSTTTSTYAIPTTSITFATPITFPPLVASPISTTTFWSYEVPTTPTTLSTSVVSSASHSTSPVVASPLSYTFPTPTLLPASIAPASVSSPSNDTSSSPFISSSPVHQTPYSFSYTPRSVYSVSPTLSPLHPHSPSLSPTSLRVWTSTFPTYTTFTEFSTSSTRTPLLSHALSPTTTALPAYVFSPTPSDFYKVSAISPTSSSFPTSVSSPVLSTFQLSTTSPMPITISPRTPTDPSPGGVAEVSSATPRSFAFPSSLSGATSRVATTASNTHSDEVDVLPPWHTKKSSSTTPETKFSSLGRTTSVPLLPSPKEPWSPFTARMSTIDTAAGATTSATELPVSSPTTPPAADKGSLSASSQRPEALATSPCTDISHPLTSLAPPFVTSATTEKPLFATTFSPASLTRFSSSAAFSSRAPEEWIGAPDPPPPWVPPKHTQPSLRPQVSAGTPSPSKVMQDVFSESHLFRTTNDAVATKTTSTSVTSASVISTFTSSTTSKQASSFFGEDPSRVLLTSLPTQSSSSTSEKPSLAPDNASAATKEEVPFSVKETSLGMERVASGVTDVSLEGSSFALRAPSLRAAETSFETGEAPSAAVELPLTTRDAPFNTRDSPITISDAPFTISEAPFTTSKLPLSTCDAPNTSSETLLAVTTSVLTFTVRNGFESVRDLPLRSHKAQSSVSEFPSFAANTKASSSFPLDDVLLYTTTRLPTSTPESPLLPSSPPPLSSRAPAYTPDEPRSTIEVVLSTAEVLSPTKEPLQKEPVQSYANVTSSHEANHSPFASFYCFPPSPSHSPASLPTPRKTFVEEGDKHVQEYSPILFTSDPSSDSPNVLENLLKKETPEDLHLEEKPSSEEPLVEHAKTSTAFGFCSQFFHLSSEPLPTTRPVSPVVTSFFSTRTSPVTQASAYASPLATSPLLPPSQRSSQGPSQEFFGTPPLTTSPPLISSTESKIASDQGQESFVTPLTSPLTEDPKPFGVISPSTTSQGQIHFRDAAAAAVFSASLLLAKLSGSRELLETEEEEEEEDETEEKKRKEEKERMERVRKHEGQTKEESKKKSGSDDVKSKGVKELERRKVHEVYEKRRLQKRRNSEAALQTLMKENTKILQRILKQKSFEESRFYSIKESETPHNSPVEEEKGLVHSASVSPTTLMFLTRFDKDKSPEPWREMTSPPIFTRLSSSSPAVSSLALTSSNTPTTQSSVSTTPVALSPTAVSSTSCLLTGQRVVSDVSSLVVKRHGVTSPLTPPSSPNLSFLAKSTKRATLPSPEDEAFSFPLSTPSSTSSSSCLTSPFLARLRENDGGGERLTLKGEVREDDHSTYGMTTEGSSYTGQRKSRALRLQDLKEESFGSSGTTATSPSPPPIYTQPSTPSPPPCGRTRNTPTPPHAWSPMSISPSTPPLFPCGPFPSQSRSPPFLSSPTSPPPSSRTPPPFGTSSSTPSPSRSLPFNPFPTNRTQRSPKQVGINLGLYSPK
ncbi:uncharacterized protein LOC143034395 [Oratosquilla oratoria]|uniref:uncharacterized protein LOC143034395 n=1 Tax=Oratosquilla oratoria TaxID=337810 RepID=UPI003F759440